MPDRAPCSIDGCDRSAAPSRNGMCWGHAKQVQRHGRVTSARIRPRNATFRELLNRALDLGEVDPSDDAEWDRAVERFRNALEAFRRAGAPMPDEE